MHVYAAIVLLYLEEHDNLVVGNKCRDKTKEKRGVNYFEENNNW